MNDRILLVEQDQKIEDLIVKQILRPLGYQVGIVNNAAAAIKEVTNFLPDLIITNLNLTGLSGNDLLVAFSSQGVETPVIVMAEKAMESNVIQSYRLGAADYLNIPFRETEVVAVVERVLNQIHLHREREKLTLELKQANLELQQQVQGFTTTITTGKAVALIGDINSLYKKILEGALLVTESEHSWILMRKGQENNFKLVAYKNISNDTNPLNRTCDEELDALVAALATSQSVDGNAPKGNKISKSGKPTLVVPIQSHNRVIGLLVVIRNDLKPYGSYEKTLLEALSDFFSFSITKLKLFQMVKGQSSYLSQ